MGGQRPTDAQVSVGVPPVTDELADTQEKMQEYINNGLRLGWLINPSTKQVEIYRAGREVEILAAPTTLSGEDVLRGFVLDLQPIFA